MTSLRLALKKSLEETPTVKVVPSYNDFPLFEDPSRINKPKRKRSMSTDSEKSFSNKVKKATNYREEGSVASLLSKMKYSFIFTQLLNIFVAVGEAFDDDFDQCMTAQFDEKESVIVEESIIEEVTDEVTIDTNDKSLRDFNAIDIEAGPADEIGDDMNGAEMTVVDESIKSFDTKVDSTIDDNESMAPSANEAIEVKPDVQEEENVEGSAGETSDEESKKHQKKITKRRSGLLRALGLPAGSMDAMDELSAETPRLPSRAAAVLAKVRLANKPGRDNRAEDDTPNVAVTPRKPSEPKQKRSIAKESVNKVALAAPEPVVAPWACCDSCQKWRKLPMFVDSKDLPDKWYCSLNEWDALHNTCDAPEEYEETTLASAPSADGAEAIADESEVKDEVTEQKSKPTKPKRPIRQSLPSSTPLEAPQPTKATDASSALRRKSTGVSRGGSGASGIGAQSVDEWVQCSLCGKWRKLPSSIAASSLPDTWLCENNTWNPAFASCKVKQEQAGDSTTVTSTSSSLHPPRQTTTRLSSSGNNSTGTQESTRGNEATTNPIPGPTKKITPWVQCDRKNCKKWRKVPATVNTADLPDKWFCELNTWDSERANCDAPEESDSENEGAQSIRPLIVVNPKSQGALSYRRIIFGADGRVKPIYSEKSKSGHGIFSYTEKISTSNKFQSSDSANNDVYEEPVKRVPYWFSSVYDETGIHYTSNKGRAGNSGAGGTVASYLKAHQKLEELVTKFTSDSRARPFSMLEHFYATKQPVAMNEPLKLTWPRKSSKSCPELENASFSQKRELLVAIIRSSFLVNENLTLNLPDLFEIVKTSRFNVSSMDFFKHQVTLDSLKLALKSMEDCGEVFVTTDYNGVATFHYLSPFGRQKSKSSTVVGDLLPPKIRDKKLKYFPPLEARSEDISQPMDE